MNANNSEIDHDKESIYKDPLIGELVNALANVEANENDLKAFKKYLEEEVKKEGSNLNTAVSGIQYSYNMNFAIYTENVDGNIIKSAIFYITSIPVHTSVVLHIYINTKINHWCMHYTKL